MGLLPSSGEAWPCSRLRALAPEASPLTLGHLLSAVGPTAGVCRLVDGRAGECCERCGKHAEGGSRHHRRSKRVRRPDTNLASNLILLCGSGTTGCHGWVHHNVKLATKLGFIVSQWKTPAAEPVTLWVGEVKLDDYGNYVPTEGQVA